MSRLRSARHRRLPGGRLLIWDRGSFGPGGKSDPAAYLINPATRAKTTLRLHGIPRAQYLTLAW